MNIIIVGCGRVGRSIAEQLNTEGHSIIVIDENPEALERIYDTQNVMAIQGNGATYSVLREAEIDSCDLLIAVTATDELNLYTCLLAKNAGVSSTIARVRNPEYISDVEIIKDDLKLTLAINPEYTCASDISRLIKFRAAFLDIARLHSLIYFLICFRNFAPPQPGFHRRYIFSQSHPSPLCRSP